MKKINLALATIMALNFSAPAFANQAGSINEAQLKKVYVQSNLKLKSENLKDLLKSQWIIENLYADNAEAFYIKNIDNPWIGAALGVLAMEGLLLNSHLSQSVSKGMTRAEFIKAHLQELKKHAGLMTMLFLAAGALGSSIYTLVTDETEIAKSREKYKRLADAGKLEAEHRSIQEQILMLSREVVELKQQLGN